MSKFFLTDNITSSYKQSSFLEELGYETNVICCKCDKLFSPSSSNIKYRNKYFCNFCLRNNFHINKKIFSFCLKSYKNSYSQEEIQKSYLQGVENPAFIFDHETFIWYIDCSKIGKDKISLLEIYKTLQNIIFCFENEESEIQYTFNCVRKNFENFSKLLDLS